MTTESISSGLILSLSLENAALIAEAPSAVAGISDKQPEKEPIGVRAYDTITGSRSHLFDILVLLYMVGSKKLDMEINKDEKLAVDSITNLLLHIGEDPTRDGLRKTPERFAKALRELTCGYNQSLEEIVNDALFSLEGDGERNMIIVRDIHISSLCEHHLLPFNGTCTIGYIPRAKVLGLSKFARIADMYSKRLQIQEHLTAQIASAIETVIQPAGVGVMIHAEHMCMTMRGIQKPGSTTTTSALLGEFRNDPRTRAEFLSLASSSAGLK
jgi:GTP cyclohydrolase I